MSNDASIPGQKHVIDMLMKKSESNEKMSMAAKVLLFVEM